MSTDFLWYRRRGDASGIARQWNGTGWIGEDTVTPTGSHRYAISGPVSAGKALVAILSQSMIEFRLGPADVTGENGFEPVGETGSLPTGSRRLATVGRRIQARLIDMVLSLIAMLIWLLPYLLDAIDRVRAVPDGASDELRSAAWRGGFEGAGNTGIFIGIGVWVVQWLMTALVGASPGKLLLGLRVADAASLAMPTSLVQAALRTSMGLTPVVALAVPSGVVTVVVLAVGAVSLAIMSRDRRNRSVMDRVALTVVVMK